MTSLSVMCVYGILSSFLLCVNDIVPSCHDVFSHVQCSLWNTPHKIVATSPHLAVAGTASPHPHTLRSYFTAHYQMQSYIHTLSHFMLSDLSLQMGTHYLTSHCNTLSHFTLQQIISLHTARCCLIPNNKGTLSAFEVYHLTLHITSLHTRSYLTVHLYVALLNISMVPHIAYLWYLILHTDKWILISLYTVWYLTFYDTSLYTL